MANIDMTAPITFDGKFNVPPTWVNGKHMSIVRKIDCSNYNLLSANTYDIMEIGSDDNSDHGYRIDEVVCQCHTAEGGAATLDVGDEDSVTRFETDFNCNSATVPVKSSDALITYTSQKSIRIQPSADLDTAVISVEVKFTCVDLSDTSS